MCYKEAHIAAIQSYAINTLMNLHKNATLLKKYFKEDFSIELIY